MITPPYLKQGDTIGIVAPAGNVKPENITKAKAILEQQGFKVVVGKNAFNQHFQFAGTDSERISDFQQMIDDDTIHAILCARGGYGCVRIVNHICFDKFIQHPKWLIGFSDVTIFHNYLHLQGIETIHGPMGKSFGNEEEMENIHLLISLLQAKPQHYKWQSDNNKHGNAQGIIVGGNLSILASLHGTPYEIDYSGKILFIEDLNEYLYHLDRMLMTFALKGIFDNIAGLIVGEFSDMKDTLAGFGMNYKDIIAEKITRANIPIAFDFPAGHGTHNYPLILGRQVKMVVENNNASLEFNT